MQTLAERLKWALDKSGMSQRALGRAAGLPSNRHIGFLTSGDRDNPGMNTIQAIASALNVSLDWLVNGDEPQPSEESLRATGDAFAAKELAEAAARKAADGGDDGEAA